MERPHKTHEACLAWEAQADALLAELNLVAIQNVEANIVSAVHMGVMTPDEGQECLTSYLATFLGDSGGTAA